MGSNLYDSNKLSYYRWVKLQEQIASQNERCKNIYEILKGKKELGKSNV